MVCGNRVEEATKRIKDNGGLHIGKRKRLTETLSSFTCFDDIKKYLFAKENLIDTYNTFEVFDTLRFLSRFDSEANNLFREVLNEIAGELNHYLEGKAPYDERIHRLLLLLYDTQRRQRENGEKYLSRTESVRI